MNRRSFLGGLAAMFGAAVLAKVAPSKPEPEGADLASIYRDVYNSVGTPALKRGDVFTIAGVFAVNPLSYRVTERLQQFVVTKDVAVGDTLVNCTPAVITAGPLQTVECRGRWRPRRDQTVKLSFSPRPMPGTDQVPLGVVDAWPNRSRPVFQEAGSQRFVFEEVA